MSTPISGTSSSGTGTSTGATGTTSDQLANNAAIQALLQQASTPPVSFGGLISGINTQQIVQALLAAQKAPVIQLQSQQAQEQSKLSAWQDISTKLQALQTASDTLGLQASVNAKSITFSGSVASGVVNPSASLGSFQLQIDNLATATQVISSNAIQGSDVATTSAKLSSPVTTGTFTVDGQTVNVTAGETFNQILADVSTQTGGIVTGTVVNNTIQLTSTDASAITLGAGGDTSNFLTVTNLAGQPSAPTITSGSPVGVGSSGIGSAIKATDIASTSSKLATTVTAGTFTVNGQAVAVHLGDDFNTILGQISAATGGAVTGSVSNNGLHLTSASAIHLGSGGDTSNFLSVVKLLGQPAATAMDSSGPVGVVNPNVVLDSANVAGLQSVANGSFAINNVTINYDTTKDTLSTIIGRINASAAGVTATYDPNSDRLILTSSKTGNIDVSLADGAGDLLSSLNLANPGAHQLGQSAKYEVNGGPAQYSLSNSVRNLVPGVTVTLQSTTTSAISATVQQDSSVGTKAIQDFVSAYNNVLDLMSKDTAFDTTTRVAGIFLGDSTVSTIQQQLDAGLFISNGAKLGLTPPYIDMSTIGLNTGDIGSAPGTTTSLKFNEETFQSALADNPQAVTNLINTVFHNMSQQLLNTLQPFGVLDSAIQSENRQINDLQNQIDSQNQFLSQQEQVLNQEFTNLDGELAQLQSQSSTGASILSSLGAQGTSSSSGSSSSASA
jgi:flagellar hook-associated protein 2